MQLVLRLKPFLLHLGHALLDRVVLQAVRTVSLLQGLLHFGQGRVEELGLIHSQIIDLLRLQRQPILHLFGLAHFLIDGRANALQFAVILGDVLANLRFLLHQCLQVNGGNRLFSQMAHASCGTWHTLFIDEVCCDLFRGGEHLIQRRRRGPMRVKRPLRRLALALANMDTWHLFGVLLIATLL